MLLLPTLLKAQTVIVLDVVQSPELNFEIANQDTSIVRGDSIKIASTINIYGGSGEYSYQWSPAESLNGSSVLSPIAFPADTTKYLLTVTDSNGCSFSINYTVNVKQKATQINNLINIQLDISVMLTPVSVILTPLAENGSKNRKYDNITLFFLNSLLSIQCGGKYAPNDPKLHRQWFLLRLYDTSLQQAVGLQL